MGDVIPSNLGINRVKQYIDDYLKIPDYSWPVYFFEKRSYSRTACIYILNNYTNDKDLKEMISGKIIEFYDMARNSNDHEKNKIFFISAEALEGLYSYLFEDINMSAVETEASKQ